MLFVLQKFLLQTKITHSLLVTVIAQFIAKTTNSEVIYFMWKIFDEQIRNKLSSVPSEMIKWSLTSRIVATSFYNPHPNEDFMGGTPS